MLAYAPPSHDFTPTFLPDTRDILSMAVHSVLVALAAKGDTSVSTAHPHTREDPLGVRAYHVSGFAFPTPRPRPGTEAEAEAEAEPESDPASASTPRPWTRWQPVTRPVLPLAPPLPPHPTTRGAPCRPVHRSPLAPIRPGPIPLSQAEVLRLPLTDLHQVPRPYFATPRQRRVDMDQGTFDTMIVTSVGTPTIDRSACQQLEAMDIMDWVHEVTSTSGALQAIQTCAPRILVLECKSYDPVMGMFSFGYRSGSQVLLPLAALMTTLATNPNLHVVYLNVMNTLDAGSALHALPCRPLVVCWGADRCAYHVRTGMLVDFMHSLCLGIPVLNSFRSAYTNAQAAAAASPTASRGGVHVSLVTAFDTKLTSTLPGVRHLVLPRDMAKAYLKATGRHSSILGAFYSAPASAPAPAPHSQAA